MKLLNKTVLITGGARRVGAAIASRLANLGARVVIHYNSSELEAQELAMALCARGLVATTIQADLSDPAQSERLIERALGQTNGRLDAIINNASIYCESSPLELTDTQISDAMRIHVSAPIALMRGFAHLTHDDDAAVVNILDARITSCDSRHAAYHIAKRALHTLTRMMALELAPKIRVNAVAPGAVLPENGRPQSDLERLAQFNPLKSYGSPQGVAACTEFLLGNEFITGQVIFYDGGYHLKAALYG